ncbi:DUF1338 domain-containing protein [Chitinibacter sp. FCG-7]|uniref:2-oxoadipate dioxygenase/decarboxylase n=1 Tax=Chitinibacter mangrovi TaxID=3153927 RepID=A0AAU7FA47_9NEIS
MSTSTFFAALWADYLALAPQAADIRQLFGGEHVINDHVAFRTFDHSAICLTVLEQPLLELGYRRDAHYEFPDKHLSAWGYIPASADDPLIFLSQLHLAQLSAAAQAIIAPLLAHLPVPCVTGADFFYSGRHWPALSWAQYQALAAESEYAAWLALHGFHANHFTIAVHRLGVSLAEVVDKIAAAGYPMNTAGGVIKGSEDVLLMQAATLAQPVSFDFADAPGQLVPGCYYEFAQRFADESGQLYQGFVAASASRIFESTHLQREWGAT